MLDGQTWVDWTGHQDLADMEVEGSAEMLAGGSGEEGEGSTWQCVRVDGARPKTGLHSPGVRTLKWSGSGRE